MRTRCAPAPSPRSGTPTRCPTRSGGPSRPGLQRRRDDEERRERARERDRAQRTRPRPAVHGADADDEQPHAPGHEAEVEPAEDGIPPPVVVAAGAEEIL